MCFPMPSPGPLLYSCEAERLAAFYDARGAVFDRNGRIGHEDMRPLRASPLFSIAVEPEPIDTPALLQSLTLLGAGDLSIGRLFEGHINACLLVCQFGSAAMRHRVAAGVRVGQLLAVWCADAAEPLQLRPEDRSLRLAGGKAFASGAGIVSQALVVARDGEARQMVLVEMDGASRVDTASWQPLGMRASMSFTVDFTGRDVTEDDLLGDSNDYFREPWFTAGCMRFGAVQLGGALAIARITHGHLKERNRGGDQHQQQRLARMWVALRGARQHLQSAGAAWDDAELGQASADEVILLANIARAAVDDACDLVVDLAMKSVGLQGLMTPHPLERRVRDLTTYLRQPSPDAAVTSIGRSLFEKDRLPW